MITPDYLDEIVKGTQSKMAEVDGYLIGRIAKRIDALFDFDGSVRLIPATINDLHKLMNKGMLVKDIEDELIKRMPELEEEIRQAFVDSASEIARGVNGYTNNVIKVLDPTGKEIKPLDNIDLREGVPLNKMGLTTPEIRNIESMYKRTNATIQNLTKTTATQANLLFVNACDEAFLKIKAGVNKNTAIVEAIQKMADAGVSVVDYPSGKVDKAEVAIARAVRTGINKANADVILTRCAEMGIKHVYVSQHLGARVTNTNDYRDHSKWQGGVYELDYSSPILAPYSNDAKKGEEDYDFIKETRKRLDKMDKGNYPDFIKECGYGQLLGICGVNCRHTFNMFIPNVNTVPQKLDEKANEERYKAEQKARAMEREKRKTMRTIKGLEGINTPEAKQALKEAKSKLEQQDLDYMQYCKDNKITPENWRRYTAYSSKASIPYSMAFERGKNIYDEIEHMQSPLPSDVALSNQYEKELAEIDKILDDVCIEKSKWSKKVIVPFKACNAKEWSCNIVLSRKADYRDKVHELLHARSISHTDPETFNAVLGYEDGVVELFAEEISKKQGQPLINAPTYTISVSALKELNRVFEIDKDDYEFAKHLFNIKPYLRQEFLTNYVKDSNIYKNATKEQKKHYDTLVNKVKDIYVERTGEV